MYLLGQFQWTCSPKYASNGNSASKYSSYLYATQLKKSILELALRKAGFDPRTQTPLQSCFDHDDFYSLC